MGDTPYRLVGASLKRNRLRKTLKKMPQVHECEKIAHPEGRVDGLACDSRGLFMPDGSAQKKPAQDSVPCVSILLVDDDGAFRERLARALRERGYGVTTADGAKKALDAAAHASFDWAIVDLRMPDCSGLELTLALQQQKPNLRVLVLTGYGSISSAVEANRSATSDTVMNPCKKVVRRPSRIGAKRCDSWTRPVARD